MIRVKQEHAKKAQNLARKSSSVEEFELFFREIGYTETQFDELYKSLLLNKDKIILKHKNKINRSTIDRDLRVNLKTLFQQKKPLPAFHELMKKHGVLEDDFSETLENCGIDEKEIEPESNDKTSRKLVGGVMFAIGLVVVLMTLSSGLLIVVPAGLMTIGLLILITGD